MTPIVKTVKATPAALRNSRSARRRARDRKRLAGRVLLGIGLLMVAFAASNFIYQAYVKADCSEETFRGLWAESSMFSIKSEGCAVDVLNAESEQRLDAGIFVSALAILVISGRTLRKYRHRYASH